MLSALLVDDEPLANDRMRNLLNAQGGIEVVGTAGSVKAAKAMLEERPTDVVFLDVEMPGGTGFDLLLSMPASTQVVFVTGHEHYAVEAFATSAVDYLVRVSTNRKPNRVSDEGRVQPRAAVRLTALRFLRSSRTPYGVTLPAAGFTGPTRSGPRDRARRRRAGRPCDRRRPARLSQPPSACSGWARSPARSPHPTA